MGKKLIISSNIKCLVIVASISLLLLSSGCGHRGPLKLPDSNASCKEVRDDRFQ